MEEFFNNLISYPFLGIGIPVVVFIICFFLVLKRIAGFVWTIFLILIACYMGYIVWQHPSVQEAMGKEFGPNATFTEKVQEVWQSITNRLTEGQNSR